MARPRPNPDRALESLASAVLRQALADARAGDEEAREWITDPAAIEVWACLLEYSPWVFAEAARRVLARRRRRVA